MTCLLSLCATQANIFINFSVLLPSPRRNVPQLSWFKLCISSSNRTQAIQYLTPVVSVIRHLTGFLVLLSAQDKMQILTWRTGTTFCVDFILPKLKLHAKSVENTGLWSYKAAVTTLKVHLDQYGTGCLVQNFRQEELLLDIYSSMHFCSSREENHCAPE